MDGEVVGRRKRGECTKNLTNYAMCTREANDKECWVDLSQTQEDGEIIEG